MFKYHYKFIFTICFLFNINNLYSQDEIKSGKIIGTVIERATQQPVIGAVIIIENTKIGTSSDINGEFAIPKVKIGSYVLKISCIGYKTILQTDVVVKTGLAVQVNIQMDEESVLLKNEVTVQGSIFNIARELTTSAYSLNNEEIRRQAGTLEDVHRLVQSMPGVVPTNDQRNDLIVRGGNPIENLTIIDNVEVPNISHFGTQGSSGGPISILNSEFIDDANFMAGGFPVQYGNKLSSVLNIKLREGNRENFGGTVNLSARGAGLMLEGPITEKGNFMISGRRSFVDLIIKNIGVSTVPTYSSFQLKATYNLDKNNKLWLISLGGIDDMDFKSDYKNNDDPEVFDVISGGKKIISGLNWLSFFDKQGYGVFCVSDAIEKYIEKSTDPRDNNRLNFENNSMEGETTIKYDVNYNFNKIVQLNTGVSSKFYRSTFVIKEPIGSQDQYSTDSTWNNPKDIDSKFNTYTLSSYVQFSKTFFEKMDINVGLRYDYFNYCKDNKSTISPRASFKFNFNPNLSVNASYGTFYQIPPMYLINAIPENQSLKPIKSEQYILGISYFPMPDIKITAEVYKKNYSQYPVSIQHPFYSIANSGDDYSISQKLIPLVSSGIGNSKGIEFYIQKRLTEKLYGQISYSYSKSETKALDGIYRLSNFDIPNILSIAGGYKFNDAWEFSTKFTFTSGRPFTPPDYVDSKLQNRQIYDVTKINSERIPDYNRLDIRIDYRANFDSWNLVTYIELQNAYDRKNVFRYIWNEKSNELLAEKQWPLMPNFGLKIEM